jgi:translation initiation factor IF-2
MMDHTGRMVKEVPPGKAAEILGFESVPNAGDRFDSPKTDVDARSIAENRGLKAKAQAAATASGKVSLEDVFSKIQAGAIKELNLILKADVFGSAEAIRDSLTKLSNEKVKVKVIHTAPGGITESDVLLATASKAIILGFNVRPETKARQVAEAQHVEIKCYNIIYELIDEVKQAMVGLLDKKKVEKFVGRAEVRQPFTVPKIGTIAGSAVIDGKMLRGANVRLLRDSRVIWDGKMSSLRRFKDDAKEVATGYECGIGLENYNDIKAGDIIEAYTIELVTPDMNG